MDDALHSPDGLVLLTGASGFIGARLTRALWQRGYKLALLCRPASIQRLRRWLDRLPDSRPRPLVLPGDLHRPRLGLRPADRDLLRAEAGEVFHLGAAYRLDLPATRAERTNVAGTAALLELAAGLPSLRRFHHVSTMAVAGDYQGVYRETDFDRGQAFPHAYGRSKFEAERLVRRSGLPATVYRPGAVVGDSRTGEIDKWDGPYLAFAILDRLRRLPGAQRLPMIVPRGDEAGFHLVPVDFVVSAMTWLATRSDGVGRTYHLTDPRPVSFRRFYLATLQAMGFRGPTIERPVERLARLLMQPGLWQISRFVGHRLGLPAEMLPHLIYRVHYDTRQAEADLAGSGIRCPSILDYLPTLIRYFEQHQGRRQQGSPAGPRTGNPLFPSCAVR